VDSAQLCGAAAGPGETASAGITLRFRTPFALAALCAGACTEVSQRDALPLTTRDSSGVEITEIGGDPWTAPTWATLDTSRVFRIAPNETRPETLFGRVRGTLGLSDGRIAVLDIGRFKVYIFAADGSFLRAVGQRGQGPGELDSPWRLVRAPGDSIAVYDFSGRLELLSTRDDGSRRLILPAIRSGRPQVLGSFAAGGYLAIMNEFPGEPQAGRNPLFSTLHVVTPAGDTGVALGRHQSTHFTYRPDGKGGVRQVTTLFWAEPGMAVLPSGYVWCLATEFDCQIWSMTGAHLRTIHAPVTTAPITDGLVNEYTTTSLAFARTRADSTRVHTQFADADRMERFPVLSVIRTDSRGRIWMREFLWPASSATARWLVFESSGRVLGTVAMPARLQVFDIGDDYILGVDLDEDDAERVVRYHYAVID
jgi:hypothetical protein